MSGHKGTHLIQKLKLGHGHMAKKPHGSQQDDNKVSLGCSISPRSCISKRFSAFSYDSEDDQRCSSPSDVPEGYLAVYVGGERKRFVIPTSYLKLPVFRTLLDKAAEEYGFVHKGGLTLPCDVGFFKDILELLKRSDMADKQLTLTHILDYITKERERRGSRDYDNDSSIHLLRASVQKSFG